MERRHEILFNQIEDFRNETLRLVAELSDEEVRIVPEGFNNNILWNLGHIYLDQYLWIQAVTKEKIKVPDGFHEWFGFGTRPADWKKDAPGVDTLIKLLSEQPAVIREHYGDRLEEEFEPTELGMYTIAQVLVRTIFHEGLHLEAIKSIRRFI